VTHVTFKDAGPTANAFSGKRNMRADLSQDLPNAKVMLQRLQEVFLFNGSEGLVAQTVSSWNQIMQGLAQIDGFRREGLFRAA
jgi:hypothetical protein